MCIRDRYWFDKILQNGEKVNLTWMCFSPTKNLYFTFVALYFHKKLQRNHFNSKNGFSSWRKLNPRIPVSYTHLPSKLVAYSFQSFRIIVGLIGVCSSSGNPQLDHPLTQ